MLCLQQGGTEVHRAPLAHRPRLRRVTDLPATLPVGAGTGGDRSAVVTGIVADGLTEPTLYGYLADVARAWPSSIQGGTATMFLTAGTGAQDTATSVLRDAATLDGVAVADREVRRVDTVEEARASADVVRRAFVACAVVALVVAGIGILNIGLARSRSAHASSSCAAPSVHDEQTCSLRSSGRTCSSPWPSRRSRSGQS